MNRIASIRLNGLQFNLIHLLFLSIKDIIFLMLNQLINTLISSNLLIQIKQFFTSFMLIFFPLVLAITELLDIQILAQFIIHKTFIIVDIVNLPMITQCFVF